MAADDPTRRKLNREPDPPSADGPVGDGGDGNGGFPIVGIGASAGGLDAFKRFLNSMPAHSGVALVLVPHLDPTHESLMVELLSRHTEMPVCEAEDDMAIQLDHVYVIPPNKYLAIVDGRLQLSTPSDRYGQPTAIDFFLRSLAAAAGERAIGIILSGTSSHGTLGLKAIKFAGGMAMVQQPETAQYDQMPRSAIATGLVDFVLSPEQMPEVLLRYVQHPYVHGIVAQPADAATREQLDRIVDILRRQTHYDFGGYRKKMLIRRVLRRMGLCHLQQLSDYHDHLRDHPEEVRALYKDLLIGVTEFFRDGPMFEVLEQRVIPELVAAGDSVRVWVPACATGEEAYSIGMLFLEEFGAQKKLASLQVFATDIDERSLEIARQGIYSESGVTDVSPERLRGFFSKIDSHRWQVNKQLRDSLTFAQQNLISGAPFSKLDLISCRNLLIYLEPDLQAKVIQLFHFALVEGGYLVLGPSESIGREVDLFEPVSKKWRVFRRTAAMRRRRVDIPIVAGEGYLRVRGAPTDAPLPPTIGFTELMRRLILEDYAPAAALINRKSEIVSVLGALVNYLEFPPGEMTRDLLALARPGLRAKLRAAISKAIRTGETVTELFARVKRDRAYASCSIRVKPLAEPKDAAGLLLVTFQDREAVKGAAAPQPDVRRTDDDESSLLRQLEQELASTRQDLQLTVESYEGSNEELKASNEEVMSMNEELQSANEELETSKEELQSLNEELNTVNNELQEKVEELDRTNSDLLNLMASSDVATVFLDTDLHIKRFTPPALNLLNLRPTDVERPFGDLAPKFDDDQLLSDCRAVVKQSAPIERVVWTKSEAGSGENEFASGRSASARCYLRRILPYRSTENHVDGVVITLVDITERIAAVEAMRRQQELNEAIIDTAQYVVLLLDSNGRILRFNRYMEDLSGWKLADVHGRDWFDTFLPQRDRERIRKLFARAMSGERTRAAVNPIVTKDGRELEIEWFDAPLTDPRGQLIGLLCTGQDVTERKQSEAVMKEREERMQAILNTATDAIITIDQQGNMTSINPATEQLFGYTRGELLGQNVNMLMPPPYRDEHDNYIARYLQTGEARIIGIGREVVGLRKDGSTFPVDLSVSQIAHFGLFTGIVRDISHRKGLEKQVLQIAVDEQRRIGQELHDGTGQELTGLSLFAGTLVDVLTEMPQKASHDGNPTWTLADADLQRLRQTASRLSQGLAAAHQHVQQLSHGIMPVQIEAGGLTSALEDLVAMTNAQAKIRCRFENPVPVEIANNVTATHLYRIAQEAVNNAMRHSQADQIRIYLAQVDDQIVLEVSDNGRGFGASSVPPTGDPAKTRGIGLEIMDYRAGILGGTLRITRREEGGTLVKCSVPVARGS